MMYSTPNSVARDGTTVSQKPPELAHNGSESPFPASHYITEFWNTVSNVAFFVAAAGILCGGGRALHAGAVAGVGAVSVVYHMSGREAWRRVDLYCTVGAFYLLIGDSAVVRILLEDPATFAALCTAASVLLFDLLVRRLSSRVDSHYVAGINLHPLWHATAAWAAYDENLDELRQREIGEAERLPCARRVPAFLLRGGATAGHIALHVAGGLLNARARVDAEEDGDRPARLREVLRFRGELHGVDGVGHEHEKLSVIINQARQAVDQQDGDAGGGGEVVRGLRVGFRTERAVSKAVAAVPPQRR
jgi:hypothetical protein